MIIFTLHARKTTFVSFPKLKIMATGNLTTMKRKFLVANETVGTLQQCSLGALVRCKQHRLYGQHMSMKVGSLRPEVRSRGYKKWYCLKKGMLVCVLIMDESVRIIARALRTVLHRRRELFVKEKQSGGRENKCPVCLTPLEEFKLADLLVHDNIVFCKQDMISHVSTGYNFTNPITRKGISRDFVARLGCQALLDNYGRRGALRKRAVDSSTHFFFMENDIVDGYKELLAVVGVSGTRMFHEQVFRQLYMSCEYQIQQMSCTDKMRTVCVLKGLGGEARGMGDLVEGWSSRFIGKHLDIVADM